MPVKYDWVKLEPLVRAAYASGERSALKRLHYETGVPPKSLSHFALRHLGLAPLQAPRSTAPWSAAEDDLLLRWSHQPSHIIASRLQEAGFDRSARAVAIRRCVLRKQGRSIGIFRDDLTIREIAVALGVSDRWVLRWIQTGRLASTPPVSQHCKYGHRISFPALRQFLIEHGTAWQHAKPDLIWLTDILTATGLEGTGRRGRPRKSGGWAEAA